MKAKLKITDKYITLPLDVMGAPQTDQSWVARADLKIQEDNLVIQVYKRQFTFSSPTKIYSAESIAKAGFTKGEYEVRRVMKYSVYPHIPAKNFIQVNPLPTGEFEFKVKAEDSLLVFTLDLSSFPKDLDKIRDVKKMLAG